LGPARSAFCRIERAKGVQIGNNGAVMLFRCPSLLPGLCTPVLLMAALACSDKGVGTTPPVHPGGDTGRDTSGPSSPDDTAPSPPDDSGTPPPDSGGSDTGDFSPYGINERPANPTCTAPERPAPAGDIRLVEAFPSVGFYQPVALLQAPGDDSRWYVAQQNGKVKSFDNSADVSTTEIFADLSSAVFTGFELGLLGMAFHPEYALNQQVFLYYTSYESASYVSRLSRFTTNADSSALDLSTETIILEVVQPASNHNGGAVVFGPEGDLYWSLGDGGSAGDPWGNGQNTDTLLGAILRIDVDGGSPYAIPEDNPFADGGGAPEIYAWGLRNAFQMAFDPATGALWAGDVGQYSWEEIDRIEKGGNYGWNTKEGTHCYAVDPCDIGGLIDPVYEYPNPGNASVVLGKVYRGSELPGLEGTLIFSDFYTGEVWGLSDDETTGEPSPGLLGELPGKFISTFGQDIDGEVLAVSYMDGAIYRMEAAGEAPTSTFPEQLSGTGCVDALNPSQPVDGMIPYGIRHAFWSDGADKERWLAIPDGTTITVGTDGDWDLPVGAVLLKHFRLHDILVETRLFVRHDDGEWAGYAYVWDEAGTEASYARGGGTTTVMDQTWALPSSAQCLQCHTEAAGRTLGLETGQLNRDFAYPSGTSDQLLTLDHIGLFSEPLLADGATSDSLASLPERDGLESLDERATAVLHVNCSICHQPDGTGGGEMDLRYATSLPDMNVCEVAPSAGDLGIPDAVLLRPGEPDESLIPLRMQALDAQRMPSVGTTVVDEAGAALIEEWITSLTDCEGP
jgi:uncharacterized repeat protein (TIGR03806 family)